MEVPLDSGKMGDKRITLKNEAEKALKDHTADFRKLSAKDVQHLVHELQVHQIELEMQNEELRRAQSELEDSRNRYSNLYDFAPIGYFTFDKNGIILEVNLTGAKILGIQRSFLIKKPFSLYIDFSNRVVFYLHLRKVFSNNTRQTCEIKLVDKDKNRFDARLESLAVQDSKGNFSQCRTAIIDITARRQAEEAIRESEEKYRSLVESANDIIAMVSPEGIIISLNPAFERITGWPCEEWLGKTFSPLIHPDDLPIATEVFHRTMNGETVPISELRLLANTGSYVHVEYVTTPLLKERKVIGNLTVARDITERKRTQEALRRAHDELEIRVKERTAELKAANKALQAEITERKRAAEALQESEGRLRSILDNSSTIVFLKDLEGRYITVNRRFEELFHVTRQTVVGKSDHDLFPQEHADRFRKHDLLALKKGGPFEVVEVVPLDDGLHVYISVKFPILNAEEKPYAVCGIATDITERKRAAEGLAKAHDELELRVQERTAELKESLEEKEILLREIHHRVKNNMQVISGLLMLQEEFSNDANIREILKESQNRIGSMALIHEKLYRSESIARIDFKEYISDLVGGLFQSFGITESKIDLKINAENIFMGIDTAIPYGLIINELVSNSLKHAFPVGKKGEIEISLRSTGKDMIELLVRDNGVGFPEGIDFRKTESLGLHIVNILVENQLHGEITMNKKNGTEFKIQVDTLSLSSQ